MARKKDEDLAWQEKLKEFKEKIPETKVEIDSSASLPPAETKNIIDITEHEEDSYTPAKREEDIEADEPAHVLVGQIRSGSLSGPELTSAQKFVVIRYLRQEEHFTQDQAAEVLQCSRRTVANYDRKIKEHQTRQLVEQTVWDYSGEIRELCMQAAKKALASGKYKDVAYVLSELTKILQSTGTLYKAPATSMQAIYSQTTHKTDTSGYQQFKQATANEEINLENVLTELINSVEQGKLDQGKGNGKND